jgi:cysteine-rich repeat protein
MAVALAPLRRLVSLVLLSITVAAPAAAQIVDVPPFTAVDGTTTVHYGNYKIAAGADSSVLVTVSTYGHDPGKEQAVEQHFSSTGDPLGALTRLDDTNDVILPRIVSDTRGGFVAFWIRSIGDALVARLLDASGAPTSPIFIATNDFPFGYVAAGLPSGFVVAWYDASLVLAQRFDVAGHPSPTPDVVASVPAHSVWNVQIAGLADGGYVVAWEDQVKTQGRMYDAAGAPRGDAFDVTDEFDPYVIAADPLGGFAVVGGRRTDTHTVPSGIWLRRFDASGTPSAPASLVDFVKPDVFAVPDAAFDPGGDLYVVWSTEALVPLKGRAYDPSGRPLEAPFGLTDDDFVGNVVVEARPDGRFWEGWRENGDLKLEVRSLCIPPTHTTCGDGVLEAPCEACDAGAGNSDTTPDTCRTTCALPACGDGVVDHSEQCDDGNLRGCDGCDANCKLEPGYLCGDGVRSADCGEECDDGPGNSDSVPNACRTDCRLPHCGDGVLDDGEGCDDGNLTSCDGCSDRCVPEPGLVCGDGIAEVLCGEQCDDGNAIVGDGCSGPCMLERIAGGGSPVSDCLSEWVVDNPVNAPMYDKRGGFSGVQTCHDGDPRCDFDGVAGTCTFHVRVCANNTDLQACTPGTRLRSWELRSPSVAKAVHHPELAAVRAAFAGVPGAIVGPTRHDVCSDVLAVPIAVRADASGVKAGSLVLKSLATLYTGEKDSDKLKLICFP